MPGRHEVHQFIKRLLGEHGYTEEITSDQSLILSGLLDSLAVVHIVVFLEETFGIDFADLYFDQTSFDSIDLIMAFIEENRP